VGNKVRDEADAQFLLEAAPAGLPLLGYLPADMAVQEADRLGVAVYDYIPSLRDAARRITVQFEEVLQ
jgi:CO dehydrogenase nickel-insertion accessory protein CooC1